MHFAVVHHVNLHAGSLDNPADFLAARTDQVADLVRGNIQHEEVRSVERNFRARGRDRLVHDVQNLQARLAGLRQGFAHHGDADARDLDIHLQRRNSLPRAGNFEIHVAVVIFGAGDVREDGVFIAFDDQAHGDARASGLERHARVHQSERTAANRGHGRGTVRFQNVRNAAHRVREIRFRGHQIRKSAFGQSAVSDFAASGTTQEFHFAHGERREVVMQHEVLERIFLEEKILALHVFLGAERGGG